MGQSNTSVKFNIQIGDELTWNVNPLLHEVRHALDNLIQTGETAIIDLRSIPLAPGEEEKILNALGRGEVVAQLDVMGASEVVETNYSGVWIVTHHNVDGETVGRFIEITTMPEILFAQAEDMVDAHHRLALALQDEQ